MFSNRMFLSAASFVDGGGSTPGPAPYYIPYGYFGGGLPRITLIDRIDYSNDTTAAIAKGPLSSARFYLAAAGNSSYGYFGGGNNPAISAVDRIDYSNDTAAAIAKGPLSAARYFLAATNHGPV